MELAHSLLLNEEALSKIPEPKRPVFIFEWLRFLDKVLVAAQKSDIKESQQKLIIQLSNEITENRGPPIRKLIASCLATIFSVGDTSALFEMINKCNDIIRNKDDSPLYLPTKLGAITCIGEMYERLGRMVGRSYEETINLLIKALKNAESHGRCEIMITLRKVVIGLGSAGSNCYKDIYKAAKNCLTERSLPVRSAAAACLIQMIEECPFIYTSEMDNITSLCFRAMDSANYEVRCDVAQLLGSIMAASLLSQNSKIAGTNSKGKQVKLDDILAMMGSGFMRGGSSFLKGGEQKGGSNINRDIRVGVTHAYVEFCRRMGPQWLERNLSTFLNHLFSLVSNPRNTSYHIDAVYARKCINFILRSVLGSLLAEKAQVGAARELCLVVVKQINLTADMGDDPQQQQQQQQPQQQQTSSSSTDAPNAHHILICALQELGSLVQGLGTSAATLVVEPSNGIIEPVVSVLVHPSPPARLAAAWCLRSIAIALPSQMTILIDRCMNRMQHLKSSMEAISGYSFALAALLGGVNQTPLRIPHVKGKQIFSLAEDLLRTASQNSRLSLQRTQSGWLLMGALMALGPSVVKSHLPRLLLLWRNAFPRSTKELESEKLRGDAFTWQVTLEGRAGALAAMHSFLFFCPELVTDDITKRLLPSLECALTMIVQIASVVKVYGAHLKASAATVRLRLYDVLSNLSPDLYETSFNSLLRELVAEFTLTDNPANTTTSRLRTLCHADDSIILGSRLQETDHRVIEDQVMNWEAGSFVGMDWFCANSASGSGALEHDPTCIYLPCLPGEHIPGPLPLGVSVIDSSVRLFGIAFPRVAFKHRLQMLEHFSECIRQAKSTRQQAVQINIFTAVLHALKNLAESKTGFGNAEVRRAAVDLVLEVLKTARDVVTRTGHSLALGCLHRYVGGMGAGQHLNTSVSILLALAQDQSSPVVQVWALHALALIADSGGPMFRTFVEPTLSLVLQLLLSVPLSNVDVHQCLGKCLAALITTIGPELHGNVSGPIATARLYCLVCCAIMQDHSDSIVQSEAISCLQQLHLFASRHVNLTTLVPHLCETLSSKHLVLRRAVVSCLRQLVQREAREVSEHANQMRAESNTNNPGARTQLASRSRANKVFAPSPISSHDHTHALDVAEVGLEAALFSLMDRDHDEKLKSDAKDVVISLLQTLVSDNLAGWLGLVKDVLQSSATAAASALSASGKNRDDDEDEDEDEDVNIQSVNPDTSKRHQVSSKWQTKVFAIECLMKIVNACEDVEAHFNLKEAKSLVMKGQGDYLVLHLSELVRMAFIAATSDSDKLRLAGLSCLQEIICKFSKIPEPEFPGHVILEQYQAQVGAALRPAFTPETAPDVTAGACEVCSTWIGSGVAHDLNDLRRVHQLLVSSLTKLDTTKDSCLLYSESSLTMEKLSVLKSWAEVSKEFGEFAGNGVGNSGVGGAQESLLSLVEMEIKMLSRHWMAMLRDYALLSLPSEYANQLPAEGGAFYLHDTMDTSRPYYKKSWPPILYAACLWLNQVGFTNSIKVWSDEAASDELMLLGWTIKRRFMLIDFICYWSICTEAMCNPTSVQTLETINMCLKSLSVLLDDQWVAERVAADLQLSIELLNVLHRLLLTRDSTECFHLVIDLVRKIVKSHRDSKSATESHWQQENPSLDGNSETTKPNENETKTDSKSPPDEIIPGKSLVFATLEVCLCVLVRHIPSLNPAIPSLSSSTSSLSSAILFFKQTSFGAPTVDLFIWHLKVPLRYLLNDDTRMMIPSLVATVLRALKEVCTHPTSKHPSVRQHWASLLQSTLYTLLSCSIDDGILILAATIFFITCPPNVVTHPEIMEPSMSLFKRAIDSQDKDLKLKAVKSVVSIVQRSDVGLSHEFIRTLGPPIFNYLVQSEKSFMSKDEINIHIEGAKFLECMVVVADDYDDHRVLLLTPVIPVMVSMLNDETSTTTTSSSSTSLSTKLHDVVLQKLIDIATQFRSQFQTVIQKLPVQRSKLEMALQTRNRQKASATTSSNAGDGGATSRQHLMQQQNTQPSIRLKMDFSNFGK
ncbi:hypothetical protein HELRODRAFT_155831 [Helobdella robusta]|uniref:HEAT repeat-containing protein 5A n=1 Tax=Helobdella robusta TaxID=6412 RepID=T1ELN1_HELRO|nr:hypothetical protein HELRODRAFT_155831 [Helobdella robusta]ESO02529.1 hypothetical protein HELRODRAFT_155831 [Helobdella robusta]